MQINIVGGSIHNALKFKKLNVEWNLRKSNLTKRVEEKSPEIIRLLKESEETIKNNQISYIDSKIKSGAELSSKELDFLKEHSPQLYDQAMKIRNERAQYKKELENCRTKEEVQALNIRKLQSFVSEARGIISNPNIPKGTKIGLLGEINARMMGVLSEHSKFVQSDEYSRLPKDDEKDKDKDNEEKVQQESDKLIGEFFDIINKNDDKQNNIEIKDKNDGTTKPTPEKIDGETDAKQQNISAIENKGKSNAEFKVKTEAIGEKNYTSGGKIAVKSETVPQNKQNAVRISVKA